VSRALRYLTASFMLLGGLKGRSGHLLKERLVFLQKSMCSGVLSRPQEQVVLGEAKSSMYTWVAVNSASAEKAASSQQR